DLARRQAEHNSGRGAAYTRSRGGGKMVYWEPFRGLSRALKREYSIKQWPKAKKEALVKTRRQQRVPSRRKLL
ncbi:MAG TPA: GIY-YIG nuclease family protein, partial [Patescibacteria group bacterium]|nr:GIY-YIG nuclease family protein [Patescibacteria group bacterium]